MHSQGFKDTLYPSATKNKVSASVVSILKYTKAQVEHISYISVNIQMIYYRGITNGRTFIKMLIEREIYPSSPGCVE